MCGDCHDAIALLLSLHVASAYANYMQHPPSSSAESAEASASASSSASASASAASASSANKLRQLNSPLAQCLPDSACARHGARLLWDSVLELLWTRFETVATANLHSLRAFDP